MRSILLASTALLAMTAGAVAADLPMARPAPMLAPLPVFTWTGFYLGAQIGGAWQRDRLAEVDVCGRPACVDRVTGRATGVVGGGHAGFNWQVGAIVFGLEGDIEGAGLRHTSVYTLSAPDTFSSQTEWQASARGRVGFAIDRALIYATGGAAFADIRHTYREATAGISQSLGEVRTGWTVGGGLEYAVTDNWTTRVEYRYADFGRKNDFPTAVFPRFRQQHDETQHAVRVGVSYRFPESTGRTIYQ